MTLCFIVIFFFFGYYVSNWRNKKKLEIARLLGIRNFVYGYCERLQEMCTSILEKVKNEALEDKEKTMYAHMLSSLSNVHDELVDIWKKSGESKLANLLQETINDKKYLELN